VERFKRRACARDGRYAREFKFWILYFVPPQIDLKMPGRKRVWTARGGAGVPPAAREAQRRRDSIDDCFINFLKYFN
jgi:hypothetical protein